MKSELAAARKLLNTRLGVQNGPTSMIHIQQGIEEPLTPEQLRLLAEVVTPETELAAALPGRRPTRSSQQA